MGLTLTGIRHYPLKSCQGFDLEHAVVERCGLAGDRRWMVVDEAGFVVTAREHPQMLLVTPELTGAGLRLRAPGRETLDVANPDGSTSQEVTVWRNSVDAARSDHAADAWLSAVIGKPVHLVYLDDPNRRQPNQEFTRADDRVSFADGYPVLLATEESLQAVNDLIALGANAHEGPLPIVRFRPNVIVRGAPAWSEDGWRALRIGEAVFRAVKGCDRCVLTTINPVTIAKGKEPIATLARHRKWDGKTWFGMNLVPDNPGATISVGDEVEILNEVPAPDGPPRPAV